MTSFGSNSQRMRLSLAVATACVSIVAGCGRGDGAASGAVRRPADEDAQLSAAASKDSLKFIQGEIERLDAAAAKYRQLEAKLQQTIQQGSRNLAALESDEAKARAFGRAAMAVIRNPATTYPVSVEGRSFISKNALFAEIQAADILLKDIPGRLAIVKNQVASNRAKLNDVETRIAQIGGKRYKLERKADSVRLAIAQKDIEALGAIVADLEDESEAALPEAELFAPSIDDVGGRSIEEKLDSFNF